MRTGGVPPPAKPEISRFPHKELPHMPGSSTTPDRAGARITLPSVLPSMILNTSAPETILFSRLNGWPMRSPVNASPASSQMPPHDSGASVVRYTFTARDFHSLLFAGFTGAPKFKKFAHAGSPLEKGISQNFPRTLCKRVALCRTCIDATMDKDSAVRNPNP